MQKWVRWEKSGANVYRKPSIWQRHRLWFAIALGLALVILIAAGFMARIQKQRTQGRFEAFVKAIDQMDYAGAADLYRQIQLGAADSGSNESEYHEVQIEMEGLVGERVSGICEDLIKGQDLSDHDRAFIEGLSDISAVEIMPLIYEKSEELLDGKITQEQWVKLLDEFKGLSNLERMINDLRSQLPGMELATVRFRVAKQIQDEGNWERTWRYWQEIVDDPELAIFAREYAEFKLKEYQEEEYSNLLNHANHLEQRGQYYSSRKLIDRMYGVFPDRPELKEHLLDLNKKLPEKLDQWTDPVPVLAVRPLLARPEVGLKEDSVGSHAYSNLLKPDEFESLLERLASENYVLIRPSVFFSYPQDVPEIIVPRGKKPLIILLEKACYSTLNQVNGSIQKLIYQEDKDSFMGFYLKHNQDVLAEDNNFYGILESFIRDHPDFVFDGGRPIVSLYLREDALGYILDPEMLKLQNEARENNSLVPYVMNEEDYLKERSELHKLLSAMINKGYELACGGTGVEVFNQLSPSELGTELGRWRSIFDLLALNYKPQILVFPDGAHVYEASDSLQVILDKGYKLLIGLGPKEYNYYFNSFVHMDRQTVSPDSLRAADAWGLSRLFSVDNILSR